MPTLTALHFELHSLYVMVMCYMASHVANPLNASHPTIQSSCFVMTGWYLCVCGFGLHSTHNGHYCSGHFTSFLTFFMLILRGRRRKRRKGRQSETNDCQCTEKKSKLTKDSKEWHNLFLMKMTICPLQSWNRRHLCRTFACCAFDYSSKVLDDVFLSDLFRMTIIHSSLSLILSNIFLISGIVWLWMDPGSICFSSPFQTWWF